MKRITGLILLFFIINNLVPAYAQEKQVDLLQRGAGIEVNVGSGLWGFKQNDISSILWTLFWDIINKENNHIPFTASILYEFPKKGRWATGLELSYTSGPLLPSSYNHFGNISYWLKKSDILRFYGLVSYYYKPNSYLSTGIGYNQMKNEYIYREMESVGIIEKIRELRNQTIGGVGWQIGLGWENKSNENIFITYKLFFQSFVIYLHEMKLDPSGIFFNIGIKYSLKKRK